MPKVNRDHLFTYRFPVPPLSEQQRIVGVLDEAFAGLATAQAHAAQNLQNARALFESHLESVFIHRGKGWVDKKLHSICREITVGYVGPMAREYTDSGVTFLRSQNILPFQVSLDTALFISPEFHAKIAKSRLRSGDVAVVRTGYPGTAAVIPQSLPESNCADLVIVRPGPEVEAQFLADIALTRDQDNPQLIFESMNSTGKELSQADLIRNFILMGLEPGLQTRLYEQFWRPMELEFGQEAYGTHFDGFMRHYLTVMTGEIPNINAVYDAFKDHARTSRADFTDDKSHIESLVREIRDYARHFCAMALGAESDADLKLAFHDLRELKVDVAYPFLLELYHDYTMDRLSKPDLLATVRWVESYVFRRAICAIPTNSLNKTFATFAKALKKDRYLESVQAHFLTLPSYRRFPTDDEFRRDLQTRDLYNFRSRSYWLRRLENFGRKERVVVDEYTIEHILPQNENLPEKWRESLGDDWQRIQQTWLHTLGNLTLTAYNSDYSDRPFAEKRDMPDAPEKGLRQSPLRLNQGLGILETWDENAIKVRAAKLAETALNVWPSPKLPQNVLDGYRPRHDEVPEYTLADHPHLLSPSMRPVFEAFRKAVLALDPCVTERFLKVYVAYKAETNFVDVIPMQDRLKLTLNMAFPDLSDPRGIARDITGLSRWGNGDVRVGLRTVEEIPYVLGLVRQSLELQLGNSA